MHLEKLLYLTLKYLKIIADSKYSFSLKPVACFLGPAKRAGSRALGAPKDRHF